jgi:hypothetical protein
VQYGFLDYVTIFGEGNINEESQLNPDFLRNFISDNPTIRQQAISWVCQQEQTKAVTEETEVFAYPL